MTRIIATPLLIGTLALAACASEDGPGGDDGQACIDCDTRVFVARDIGFATEEGDGVAEGFDLDGVVSSTPDPSSCNRLDYVAPDGRQGIDNQFAVLWKIIDNAVNDAVDGLVRGAINDGSLLFMLELSDLDDQVNDDCVDLTVFLGSGQPDIGTDRYITSGQTFDRNPNALTSFVACGELRDGVLLAGPFDGTLPVSVLDFTFDLRVYDAMVRAHLHPDGSMSAVIGAAVDADQIIEVGEDADRRLQGLVEPLVRGRVDLYPDEFGDCQKLSATMLYDGVSAFLYEDSP